MSLSPRSLPLVGALLTLAVAGVHAADGDAPIAAPAPVTDAELKARVDALEAQLQIVTRNVEVAQETAAGKAKDNGSIKAGADGFSFVSGDGQFSLKIGGYTQVASKFYLTDEDKPSNNSFFIKRSRLVFDGVLGEHIAFRVMPDLATGNVLMQDAYVELRLKPEFAVRAGKFKLPIGLERLQSDATLLFIERSLETQLTPDRDEGLQLGGVVGGKLDYAVGIFNGPVDNGSRDGDVNDQKQGAARLFFSPFKGGDNHWLSGFGFGVGGSLGDEEGTLAAPNLPNYKTSGQAVPGGTANWFAYRSVAAPIVATAANTAIANGWQWRIDPQAYWYAGPYHLQGEYIWSAENVQIANIRRQLINTGWDIEAGWVLTGDDASFTGVKPRSPFSLKNGNWGAWEIGLRAARIDIDDRAYPLYAAPNTAARSATSYGAALNWYLSRNLKLQTDYEFTKFNQGAGTVARPRDLQSEHVIESQLQFSF